ncbi:menaquinone-dependent protoporphyrinogen IX dehydrogenase [Polaribacter undariae]|uniref:Protoporphyrinogen IX dehydrogenase [quinone] n=1 Tax=Polaribacter sejongensis TaxID=985043 RepID=A0AAJ1QVS7_9FLAO|nr:menaquinone-dependent protoporphyrinogen IX dehydrogenase [Polaribacter undariae]MDN3618511.1 menaquinone-dependent protoporphyrinogen IX dehydrogenase [Polaribacter undariae]UWD30507.1 menaquinone-dependent protoporphyrinogen IX dehydrogenase [Polaribacter undariae]
MERKIGIIYSSIDGQTKKICEELSAHFKKEQIKSALFSIENFNDNLSEFDTLIIGASIRYGKHNKQIYDFILKNKEHLKEIKTAFFSVNLVARKENKNSPSTNPYLIKFIKEINWTPDLLEVFAGKLDYKSYSLIDRIMIKLIMRLTDGPTKSKEPIEFTNWKKVNDFGIKISQGYKNITNLTI